MNFCQEKENCIDVDITNVFNASKLAQSLIK